MSNAFVCLMGFGTVFIGLICIVFLSMAMSAICQRLEKKPEPATAAPVTPKGPVGGAIPNRTELVAAISAVLAEEMGAEVSAIRIVSLKRI